MKPSEAVVVLLFLSLAGCCRTAEALSQSTVCTGVTEEEGGYLNGLNLARFEGCQIVNGNLIINGSSFESNNGPSVIVPSSLSALSNITTITGYLHLHDISHPSLTELKYLNKLRHIGGNDTVVYFMIQHFALVITNVQFLETLNLASLTTIARGGIKIDDNPRLCLVNTITYNALIQDNPPLVRTNGNNNTCTVSCHTECKSTTGCWGLEDNECISCRNYRHGNTCVNECDQNITFSNGSVCHSCHYHCHDQHGCTGPAHHLGDGGCNQCADTVHVINNSTSVCGIAQDTITTTSVISNQVSTEKFLPSSSHSTPTSLSHPSSPPVVTPSQPGTLPPSPSPVSTQFPLLATIVTATVVATVTILTVALVLIAFQAHKRSRKKKRNMNLTRQYTNAHQVMVTAWNESSNGEYNQQQRQSAVSLAGLANRHHAAPHSPYAPPLAPPSCQYGSRRTSASLSTTASSRGGGIHSHHSSTSNSYNSTRTHYPSRPAH